MTCTLSGLPITGGTAVRCLLLTQTPYDDSEHRGSSWIVRTPPLRAQYDDYGSIHKIHPEDEPIKALWMRGLREDLVEQGQGDNPYHDAATSRTMTFEDLLSAIRSRRVFVTREFAHPALAVLEEGASFRREVEEALRAKLGDRVGDRQAPGSWCVDEPVPNLVRVRYSHCGAADAHMAELHRALEAVRVAGLSGAIGAGSGRSGCSPDLLVFPAPGSGHMFGPQWDMATGQSADPKKTLRIGLAMIREDVWQRMIAFPHRDYVSLPCLVCGQSPSYHKHRDRCPDTDAYGKPLSIPPGARYVRGPVFPEGVVEHAVERRDGIEYVVYGLEAFKHSVRTTWQRVVNRMVTREWPYWAACDREDETPPDPNESRSKADAATQAIIDRLTARWKEEDARISALPLEEQERLLAAKQAARERHEAERIRRRERPHFTDFPIRHDVHNIHDMNAVDPGAWILQDSIPTVIGIPEHLAMYLADRAEVPGCVLDGIAELAAIRAAATEVGATWKPAVSSGPQDPQWGEQARFSRMVLDIALERLDKYRAVNDEQIEEEPPTLDAAMVHARRAT